MARRARVQIEGIEIGETEGGGTDQSEAIESPAERESESSAETSASIGGFNVAVHADDEDSIGARLEVVEAQPKRGRPKGTTAPRVTKATANEIAQAAPLLVGLSNQVVVTWMGPECAMLQTEANFLTPSVARILSRLPKGAAQQVSLFTDPFIVLTALGLWAARIQRVKAEQARRDYQVAPFEAARAYGESGTEFTGASPIGQTPEPVAQPDESRNGSAKAQADAIFRTVSPA